MMSSAKQLAQDEGAHLIPPGRAHDRVAQLERLLRATEETEDD